MRGRFTMPERPPWTIAVVFVSSALALTSTRQASAESAGTAPAASEAKAPENSIFLEGFGAAVFYSANYERMVLRPLGVHIGLGLLPVEYTSSSSSSSKGGTSMQLFAFIPVGASYVGIRAGSHALELGAGATFAYGGGTTDPNGDTTNPSLQPIGMASVGYRYQPVDRAGFMFRVGAEALVARRDYLFQEHSFGEIGIAPWPYLSLGASF
jgi:hypothetical protein